MELPTSKRHYSNEEKRQLLLNLDIEVAHRTRQFESWLADKLENFTLHQEGLVSRIPKQVRTMTLREFGSKYDGNIQSALRGYQKERLAAAGVDPTAGEIDKSMRKRKWVASQESETESSQVKDTDSQRGTKNARMQPSSPKKVAGSSTGPGTAQRSRLLGVAKTPGSNRVLGRPGMTATPQKSRPPFNNSTAVHNPRPSSRPASPLKRTTSNPNLDGQPQQQSRVPSSSSFNPMLPPKTPSYPPRQPTGQITAMRLPRKDENMLSVNGSPLANPYEFGLGWFKGVEMASLDSEGEESQDEPEGSTTAGRTLKRTKSSIVIRRDPSVAFPNGLHSRTESQASFYTASSSRTTSSSHSRDNSHATELATPKPPTGLGAFRFPASHDQPANTEATPRPAHGHTRTFSALVAIPTSDGHLLEFDPLQTSPRALDALEGISDSAKKQAKAEMARLIQATVDKWKIL
ncbi:hypothetical protein D9613_005910 [Agrocybe pediades]|uniref:Borealin N-terminal domain-containing protein n=1 Tax=Agrocybe pediades TaxID=84607 RepID=A0A8H4QVD1_9AGAR|nr:hypothetical protein D9613_005910 [Agrocybe pediades]KAF9554716.1 hypothetical protein CPC08DRAFT_712680 [Agrocybe pediades]